MASSVKDGCEKEEDLLDDLLHKNHEEDNDLFDKDEPSERDGVGASAGGGADANHSDISDEESHHEDEARHHSEEDISDDEAEEDRKMARQACPRQKRGRQSRGRMLRFEASCGPDGESSGRG